MGLMNRRGEIVVKRKVVTLCGSVRFWNKIQLGELHRIKIDLSDAIFVVNVDGYIGESVKKEIEYAKQKGKEIFYLESAD